MAAYIQSKSVADLSGGTSLTLAFTSNVTAHSTLVTFARNLAASGNITGVSDNVNGAWTKRFSQAEESNSVGLDCWYFLNAAAGATTVTITQTVGGTMRWAIAEGAVSATGVAAVDTSASNKDDVSSTAVSSGNITTANAVEWIVAGVGCSTDLTFTVGSGYTLRETPPTNGTGRMALEEQTTSSSGTYAGTFTLSTSLAWAAGVIAFKDTAVTGGFLSRNFWWGNY